MENSILELPKWHWKFIASVLLFRNCSGKHTRWKRLLQVCAVSQRIKTWDCSAPTVYSSLSLATATRRNRPQSSQGLEPKVVSPTPCRAVSHQNLQAQTPSLQWYHAHSPSCKHSFTRASWERNFKMVLNPKMKGEEAKCTDTSLLDEQRQQYRKYSDLGCRFFSHFFEGSFRLGIITELGS